MVFDNKEALRILDRIGQFFRNIVRHYNGCFFKNTEPIAKKMTTTYLTVNQHFDAFQASKSNFDILRLDPPIYWP